MLRRRVLRVRAEFSSCGLDRDFRVQAGLLFHLRLLSVVAFLCRNRFWPQPTQGVGCSYQPMQFVQPPTVATVGELSNFACATRIQIYSSATLDDVGVTPAVLLAQTQAKYDEKLQVWRTIACPVAQITFICLLTANRWYTARGLLAKTAKTSSLFTKTPYIGTKPLQPHISSVLLPKSGPQRAQPDVPCNVLNRFVKAANHAGATLWTGTGVELDGV